MRKKAEREQAREEEQVAIKAEKEREIARLRSLQEKAQDQQALFDELNAQRIQEEVEREWRTKQLAIAKKKKEDLEQLHLARAKQIEDIRKAQAIELARDEQQFHQVNYKRFYKFFYLLCFVVFRMLNFKPSNMRLRWKNVRGKRKLVFASARNC